MKIGKLVFRIAMAVGGLLLTLVLIAVTWINLLDRTDGTIEVGGETRAYLLYLPDSYDGAEPVPLVISLHAAATWPAHQQNITGWNRVAEEEGFLVVYPAGTPQLFGIARIWRPNPATVMKDVRFIAALIDSLENAYDIDPARVYADGLSNGGGMAYALSCTLPDRIAAVGLVGAAMTLPSDWCPQPRPVPVMAFHGDADPLVPYEGGPLGDPFNPVKTVFPPVRDWVEAWAERNRCAEAPVRSAVAPDVTRLSFRDCAEGADVIFHTLRGGGHTWPGGEPMPEWRVGPTNTSIDATRELWAFYEAHPLVQR